MFVARRALLFLFLVLSQPLAAFDGACVVNSAKDGQTTEVFPGQNDAERKPDNERSDEAPLEYDDKNSPVSCGGWKIGRVPGFCIQLA